MYGKHNGSERMTKLLQVYIPEEVYEKIEKIKTNFNTRSACVQHLLKNGLEQEGEKQWLTFHPNTLFFYKN